MELLTSFFERDEGGKNATTANFIHNVNNSNFQRQKKNAKNVRGLGVLSVLRFLRFRQKPTKNRPPLGGQFLGFFRRFFAFFRVFGAKKYQGSRRS